MIWSSSGRYSPTLCGKASTSLLLMCCGQSRCVCQQMTADHMGFLARQGMRIRGVGLITDQLAGAEQHQAVHQNGCASGCRGAVDLVLVLNLSIDQVPGQS
ncbi:hypothetical protein D9M70_144340 [compost metagenome]